MLGGCGLAATYLSLGDFWCMGRTWWVYPQSSLEAIQWSLWSPFPSRHQNITDCVWSKQKFKENYQLRNLNENKKKKRKEIKQGRRELLLRSATTRFDCSNCACVAPYHGNPLTFVDQLMKLRHRVSLQHGHITRSNFTWAPRDFILDKPVS